MGKEIIILITAGLLFATSAAVLMEGGIFMRRQFLTLQCNTESVELMGHDGMMPDIALLRSVTARPYALIDSGSSRLDDNGHCARIINQVLRKLYTNATL